MPKYKVSVFKYVPEWIGDYEIEAPNDKAARVLVLEKVRKQGLAKNEDLLFADVRESEGAGENG